MPGEGYSRGSRRPGRELWQQLGGGDFAYRSPADRQGGFLVGFVHAALAIRRLFGRARRIGEYFDLPRFEVQNPVGRNAGAGIHPGLDAPIALQRGIGDFDDQLDR